MNQGGWVWASCVAAGLVAASCSFRDTAGPSVAAGGSGQSLTAAASKAPERAIAVVLDTSRNLGPQCFEDWNTAKHVSSTFAPDGLFAGMTQTLCDSVPRWQRQRDGLIQALRAGVPIDGSVAVSVVADALHQVGESYAGPRVVVPYTVIRSEADRNAVIDALLRTDLSLDRPTTDYTYGWKGSTCKGSYDSAQDRCYSPASHAWAAALAREQLDNACPAGTPASDPAVQDASVADAAAQAPSCQRPKRREICLIGDATHTRLPVAFWDRGSGCASTLNGGTPDCELNWPANVPEPAKFEVPFESIAGVDRFTVVQHDVGVSPAMHAASKGSLSATPNPLYETDYGQPAWGAAISVAPFSIQGPAPSEAGEVRLQFSVVRSGSAAVRQIASITIALQDGSDAEAAASQIYAALDERMSVDPASLPVRASLLGHRVLLDWNPSFDFDGNGKAVVSSVIADGLAASADDGFFPALSVAGSHPAFEISLSGGAITAAERAVQNRQVVLAREYGTAMQGKGSIVFPSGFLPNAAAADDAARSLDFGHAIVRCFEECDHGDVILDHAPGADDEVSGDLIESTAFAPLAGAAATATAAPMCVPIELVAVEVNQVIQTWKNDIPLIKDKLTGVRVFLLNPASGNSLSKVRLRGYAYALAGQPCDPEIDGSACKPYELLDRPPPSRDIRFPQKQASLRSDVIRSDLDKSATFLLPASWTKHDILELKVEAATGANNVICKEHADETPANDCRIRTRFTSYQRPTLGPGTPVQPDPGGTLVLPGVGRPISLRQVVLHWEVQDSAGDLDVTEDDRVTAARALERMLPMAPLDIQLYPGWNIDVRNKLATWRTQLIPGTNQLNTAPDIAWYRQQCPTCNPAQPLIEEAWLSSVPSVFAHLQNFRDLFLGRYISDLRKAYATTPPKGGNEVYHGVFHTPLQTAIGGVSVAGSGTLVEDVGAKFDAEYTSGAHEFLHAVGRFHTDYCIPATSNQRPKCDEPYPYELVAGALRTTPGTVSMPASDTRPLLGPIDGDPWNEVWGFELGKRRERTAPVAFPRPRQSSPSDFQVVKRVAYSPRTTYDIMSYCVREPGTGRDRPRWMSKFQYERLFGPVTTLDSERVGEHLGRFAEFPSQRVLPLGPVSTPASPNNHTKWCEPGETAGQAKWQQNCKVASSGTACVSGDLLVSGLVNREAREVVWDPAVRVPGPLAADAAERFDDARGVLSLRDASGDERYRVETPLDVLSDQATPDLPFSALRVFFARVPSDEVREIVLLDGSGELGRIRATASQPQVAVDADLTGAVLASDTYTFRWSGSDADPNPNLQYFVAYSSDDGVTYQPLSAAMTEQELVYPLKDLPGTDTARLRVTVSDGFNSTFDVSGRFRVARKPPRSVIVSLVDGERYSGPESILLDAVALDAEEGSLSEDALVWTSDRDGVLGTGLLTVNSTELSEGIHQITVTATDRDGLTGLATRTIEIRHFETDLFQGPRLQLDCTHDGDFEVNREGSYLLRIKNVGASEASGALSIRDVLPAELTYLGASGDGWTCDESYNLVRCTRPNVALPVNASAPSLTLRVRPRHIALDPPATYYDVTNLAEATVENGGPEAAATADDETRVLVPPPPAVDVSLQGPGATVYGQPLVYKLDVGNTGNGPAYEMSVAFSIPAGATITAASGATWSCSFAAQSGSCISQTSPVPPGTSLPQLTITVAVQDRNLTSVQLSYSVSAKGAPNAADAGPDGGERVTSTSSGNSQTRVQDQRETGADLTLRVLEPCEETPYWEFCRPSHQVYFDFLESAARTTVDGDAARVRGGAWSQTIVVTNVGSEAAEHVEFSWLMPPDVIWHSSGTLFGGEVYSQGFRCELDERVVRCVYDEGALEVGEEARFRMRFGILADAAPWFTHYLQVRSDDGDPDLRNNQAEHTTTLYASELPCLMRDDGGKCIGQTAASASSTALTTDITITDPLVVGQPGEATFTVRNVGGVAIRKNTISLQALGEPSLLEVDGYNGAGWSCGLRWGQATCLYLDPLNGNLLGGESLPPLRVTFRTGPHPYAMMRIPAEVAATGVQSYRSSITTKVQQTDTLQGPVMGTLAYTACPPGYDCKQYLPDFPSNYTQASREIRLLDLSTLQSTAVPMLYRGTVGNAYAEPAWSPDGTRLACLLRSGVCTPELDGDCTGYLFVEHLTTRASETYFSAGDTSESIGGGQRQTSGSASWSPDGTHLMFVGATLKAGPVGTCAPQYFGDQNLDCFELRRTTVHTRSIYGDVWPGRNVGYPTGWSTVTAEAGGVLHPDWSPTGNRVAYISGEPSKIWLVDVATDGSSPANKRRLTASAASVVEERPAFSPDGSRVAFSSDGNLHIVRIDGTDEFVLTSAGSDTHPTWSPDGAQIAFERGEGDPGIFVVAAMGGAPVLVARGMHPAWKPATAATPAPPSGQPPVARADLLSTGFATAVSGNVLANDSDPAASALSVVAFTQGARGAVTCTSAGTCTYSPQSGFVGGDAFSYTIANAAGARATASVRVDVSGAAPGIAIVSPIDDEPVGSSNTALLRGTAWLDQYDPTINVLYVVDTHNKLGLDTVLDEFGAPIIPGSGLPRVWQAPPAGHTSLCGTSTVDNTLIDCYLRKLNQSLIGTPSVNAGVILFADDYLGTKPSSQYYTMESPQHFPPDYRPNVFSLDMAATTGHDAWIGPGVDNNANGQPDIEEVMGSIQLLPAGTVACGFGLANDGDVSKFTAGGRVFGPPLGRPTAGTDPRRYPPDIMCRQASLTTQTYDWVLDSINRSFAARSATEHNVAYLFSAGRPLVSEDTDSPLQAAIRAGTVIHTYAPKAVTEPDPVDVIMLVNTTTSSAAERTHISARLQRFALQLAASGLDYKVTLAAQNDWFAGTGLNYEYRSAGADAIDVMLDEYGRLQLPVRPEATVHIIGVNLSDSATRGGHYALDLFRIYREPYHGKVGRGFFGHAVSRLGSSWCPGTAPADAGIHAFEWAGRRGVKLLTCADDWDALFDAIRQSSSTGPSARLAYAVAGERYLGSCESTNPLAKIAQKTGGTCTELDWDAEDVVAKLPAAPRLGVAAGSNVADGIARVELSRPGQAPTLATVAEDGQWTGAVPNLVPGTNVLTARLYTTHGQTVSATVRVVAQNGYNRSPIATDQHVRATLEPLTFDLLRTASDPDGDLLTVTLSGTVPSSLSCNSVGLCTYTPVVGDTSEQIVAYSVRDGRGGSAQANLFIAHNQPPVAIDHGVRVEQGEAVTLDLLAGASDPDGDPLEVRDWTLSSHGKIGCLSNGSCTYVASKDWSGMDRFEYTVADPYGALNTARVSVIVSPRGRDVAVTLRHTGDLVVGLEQRFEAVVYNLAEAAQSGAVVRVDIPASVYTRVDGAGWSCTQGAPIECQSTATVAAGQTFAPLGVYVIPDAIAVPRIEARAMVVVANDLDPTNDEALDRASVHAAQIDAALELGSGTANVCGRAGFVVNVRNPGGRPIAAPLQVAADIPSELALASVTGQNWSCNPTAAGFRCVYGVPLAALQEPPALAFELTRRTPTFGVRSLHLQLTAAGDEDPTNDAIELALTLLNSQLDQDGDGYADCADNCPVRSNPAQSDLDQDGHGDACDNCPQTANPDQSDGNHDGGGDACQPTVDIRWVASNGSNLAANVLVTDPNGDPVDGQVALYGGRVAPRDVLFEVLTGCGSGKARIKLNGQLIATPSWGTTQQCRCADRIANSWRIFDPELLAAYDTSGGSNVLTVEMEGGSARQLAWIRAQINYRDDTAQGVCLFDARAGGTCSVEDACTNGVTDQGISVARTLDPTPDTAKYFLEDYTGSTPGRAWRVHQLSPGPYSLVVTGTDGNTPSVSDSQAFTYRHEDLLDINSSIDLMPQIYVNTPFEACGEVRYNVDVIGVGTQRTLKPIRVRGSFPPGIEPTSVDGGWQWTCSSDESGFDCQTSEPLGFRESTSGPQIWAKVRAAAGTLITFSATVSTLGDENATNDTAYVSEIVNDSYEWDIDLDQDGVPACLDVCPNDHPELDDDADGYCDVGNENLDNCVGVANPTQKDSDGDGIGDACDTCPNRAGGLIDSDGDGVGDDCDNCPANRNPDQADHNGDGGGDACQPTVDIRSLTPDGQVLFADVSLADPNGDPLHGEVRVLEPPQRVDAITIDVLSACDVAIAKVWLNGHLIDTYETAPTSCSCDAQVDQHTIPAAAFAQWYREASDNHIEVELKSTLALYEASVYGWVNVAVLYEDGEVDEFCAFDAGPSRRCIADPVNLCSSGYTFDPEIRGEQPLPARLNVLVSVPYAASELPAYLDLAGVPTGSYELQVTANDSSSLPAEDRMPFELTTQGRIVFASCSDRDADGVCDGVDNCAALSNADQSDADRDGRGDACDECPNSTTDDEGDFDGVCDDLDNCISTPNPDQRDSDQDGRGDACDMCPQSVLDDWSDFDGVCDDIDNCFGRSNATQLDSDGDARGDVCDECPHDPTNDANDADGVCDDVDNCVGVVNPDQRDSDGDAAGDACDLCVRDRSNDADSDGRCADVDNCPLVANAGQSDADSDGAGDACDVCPNDAGDDSSDGDGVCDDVDNCPGSPNPGQADADADGLGDACDSCAFDPSNDGSDRDGVCDDVDNCRGVANFGQVDTDRDGLGNACDACPEDAANDAEHDGVCAGADNCPGVTNSSQADADGDRIGDACDACPADADNDVDGDGYCANADNCPGLANAAQLDADGDAIGDACDACPTDAENDLDRDGVCGDADNCPHSANSDQSDADHDGAGDACDTCPSDVSNDSDGDGVCGTLDNCPGVSNAAQFDADADGLGDACDVCPNDAGNDIDADGVCRALDNCPSSFNPSQADADRDGLGDTCDACPADANNDADRDGVCGDVDNCPSIANASQADADRDGLGDACDGCGSDKDHDGVCDNADNCPNAANASQQDRDGDGLGDICDACPLDAKNDIDRDGVCGDVDNCPNDANASQKDRDRDGLGDACDSCPGDSRNDTDRDGVRDEADNCPTVANGSQSDRDRDGIGDACDKCPSDAQNDRDHDGVCGNLDNCPDVANPSQVDADRDGIGDACDTSQADSDRDGVPNKSDKCPNTKPADRVHPATGCSIAQLCPCSGPTNQCGDWRNHGQYVSCVSDAANDLVRANVVTGAQKGAIVSEAAQSSCGK